MAVAVIESNRLADLVTNLGRPQVHWCLLGINRGALCIHHQKVGSPNVFTCTATAGEPVRLETDLPTRLPLVSLSPSAQACSGPC